MTEIDGYRRSRQFMTAYYRARKLFNASSSEPVDRFNAARCIGRIYFEFGRHEAAAWWLSAAEAEQDGVDLSERGSVTALRIWAEYRQQMPRNWVTRYDVKVDLADPILDEEHRSWLYRLTEWRVTPRTLRNESADLILAGLQQFRSRCLADPQDRTLVNNARRYFKDAQATGLFTGEAGGRYDQFLSMSSVAVQFQYHWAAFLFESDDLEAAWTEFEKLFAMREGEGHVIGRLASAQLARAMMKPAPERRQIIRDAIERISEYYFRHYDDPAITDGSAAKVMFDDELHYLCRQEADSYAAVEPGKANLILEDADTEWGDGDVSYGRPRYLATLGVDRPLLEVTVQRLAEASGLADLTGALVLPALPWEAEHRGTAMDTTHSGPHDDPDSVDSVRGKVAEVLARDRDNPEPTNDWRRESKARALIAIVDVLRALGADSQALAWYRLIAHYVPSSGLACGRLVSLLSSLGHHGEAVQVGQAALAPPCEVPFEHRTFIEVELARAELELGNYEAAAEHFGRVAGSRWRQLAIDGYMGQIDVARRSRHLIEARAAVERARCHFAGCDQALQAEIDIGEGWVEIQLGNPRQGFRLLRRAIRATPYNVGAWIGLVRALRMLGKHRQALAVTARLSGQADDQPLPWLDAGQSDAPGVGSIPTISLRHGGRLRNERGWTLLDLDRIDEAEREFTIALQRSPNLAPCYRGIVLASAHSPNAIETSFSNACSLLSVSSRHQTDVLREIHLEAGRALVSIGHESAAHHFDSLLRMTSDAALPQTLRRRYGFAIADAYLAANDIPAASNHLRDVLRAQSRDDGSHDDRAMIFRAKLAMARGEPDDALSLIASHLEDGREVGEALRIAHFVAAFEAREFVKAEQLVEAIGTLPMPEGAEATAFDEVPESEIKSLLKAWTFLVQSELPGSTDPGHRVRQARELIENTDESSLEELHLRAILEARGAVINEGSFVAANQYIDLAIDRRPHDPALLRDKAAIERSLGRLRIAVGLLENAERRAPYDPRVHLLTGAARFALGDTTAAVQSFRSAVALDPNDYVHHRALALALADLGQLDDAVRATSYGIETVRTSRKYRLKLLQARLVAQKSQELPTRKKEVQLSRMAERLERAQSEVSSPGEHAEVLARRAYIAAHQGNYPRARRLLTQAQKHDNNLPEIGDLRDQLPRGLGFAPAWGLASALVGQAAAVILLVVMLFSFLGGEPRSDLVSLTGLLALIGLVAGMPFIAPLIQRVRSLRLFQTTIELADAGPVPETVHVDLDMSASDLLRISGFSNHRPTVPFDDVEPRTFDYD